MIASALRLTDEESDALMADAEYLNGTYPDAITFVARYLTRYPETSQAEITGVDTHGVTLRLGLGDRNSSATVAFTQPAGSLDDARAELQQLVPRARAKAGAHAPMTSIERELERVGRLTTFHTAVAGVEDVTPGIRQLTFKGGLEEFSSVGPDQYLLVTPLDRGPESGAYYTVRRWRTEAFEMDMWFVLHDHPDTMGSWAASAEVGEQVSLWGPRHVYDPPQDTTHLLLVADETGLAAVCAMLEARRPEMQAQVVLEATDPDHTVSLPTRPGDLVQWQFRKGAAPGRTRLVDAVIGLQLDIDHLYAFGAGESRQVTAVRRHLRQNLGMRQSQVHMTGYWRRPKHDNNHTRGTKDD